VTARPAEYDGAGPFVPADRSLPSLRSAAQGCRGCDLYQHATQAVVGDGPVSARLVLVGEQPGDQEDKAGEPFVGPAGRVLDRALEEAGIARDDVFVTNAVKHFRFETKGKRRIHQSPTRWQVAACQPWLLSELDLVRPTGVVLLGATAGAAVHGPAFRLGARRGLLEEWPSGLTLAEPPVWVLATTHPSAVLRATDREAARAGLVADLQVAARALAVA
jgi:uracil-DNA glycosylase family protein